MATATATTKMTATTSRLKLASVRWLRRLANIVLLCAQSLFYKKNNAPRRILVFRTGSFGDSLCALPALASIRRHFPAAQLDVLTNTGHAGKSLASIEQLAHPSLADGFLHYGGMPFAALARQLRARHYDLVIQLPQYNAPFFRLLRDLLAFRLLCGIPAGFGWQLDHVPVFLKTQEKSGIAENERRRLLALLGRNGVPPLPETHFDLHWNAADEAVAQEILARALPDAKPALGFVVGAKRPQNRWPVEHFRRVAVHFAARYRILLFGGPDDQALASTLETDHVFSLCGRLTPLQNAWAMRRCQLVLANDTGPMHLAYASGVPLVALFSSRDLPGRWFPPEGSSGAVFRTADIACSACFSETCADNICMKKISPEEVIEAMEEILQMFELRV